MPKGFRTSTPLKDMTNSNNSDSQDSGGNNSAEINGTMDEDERKRKEIRKQYRQILERLQTAEEEIVEKDTNEDSIDVLKEVADKANDLYEKVKEPQEAIMDAHVVRLLNQIVRRKAEGMSTNVQVFRPSEYADKLIHAMHGRVEEDGTSFIPAKRWMLFGKYVKSVYARPPCLDYVFGSFEQNEIVKKERQKRIVPKVDKESLIVTKSTKLLEAETSENQTEVLVTSTLKSLYRHYKAGGKKPLGYFNFVLDPNFFSKSVENIFHVSFLVKEGRARIEIDSRSGLPVISPFKKHASAAGLGEDESGDTSNRRKQVVINMTMQYWNDMKEALNITQPMIVHESQSQTQQQQQQQSKRM